MDTLDTLGMFDATASLPEQVEQAVADAAGEAYGLPARADIANVLVLGMGGSGIAGDVLAAVAGPFMPVPVVVCKGYEPPSFVDESTLVIALSFSGDTEEILEAVETAALSGGKVLAVTRGGRLADRALAWEAPVLRLPEGIPMPRAALGALVVPPLVVLEQMGLFPGAGQWIARAVDQLKRRRDQLVADANPAADLARHIGRTLPIIYGGGDIGAVAALRWKSQCNENAKLAAFANTLPELCHNEICGWGQHGDLTRQVFTVVHLRHDHEHPQVMRRFELVAGLIDEVVAEVHEICAEGDGALAQLLDLVLFGDFTSLHLAAQEGLDPGPVPALDHIKSELADH
ncbi:bifunctional phosphoglucose/phosphomannose isomerase [soil metagenome]